MTELGLLLAKARDAKGWSLQKVATRLGVSRSAVNQWELGTTSPDADRIPQVCELLSIDTRTYMRAVEAGAANSHGGDVRTIDAARSQRALSRSGGRPGVGQPRRGRLSGDASAYEFVRSGSELPVYGARDSGGGLMDMSQQPTEEVDRAPFVAEAFDLYVECDVMGHAYERGDRIRVFPGRPIKRGTDVLLLTSAVGTGPRVAIRRLVEITDTHWVCKQWVPEKTVEFPREEWPLAYRIIGVFRQ